MTRRLWHPAISFYTLALCIVVLVATAEWLTGWLAVGMAIFAAALIFLAGARWGYDQALGMEGGQ
jgi:hypothetical protein